MGHLIPPSPERPHPGPRKRARQVSSPQRKERLKNHEGGWAGHFLLPCGVGWFPAALRLSSTAKFSLQVWGGFSAWSPGLPALCWSRAAHIKESHGALSSAGRMPYTPGPPLPALSVELVMVKQRGNWGPTGAQEGRSTSHLARVLPGSVEPLKVQCPDQ